MDIHSYHDNGAPYNILMMMMRMNLPNINNLLIDNSIRRNYLPELPKGTA